MSVFEIPQMKSLKSKVKRQMINLWKYFHHTSQDTELIWLLYGVARNLAQKEVTTQ